MPILHYRLGYTYNTIYQYDKAIPELEKALEIYNKWDLKPYHPAFYNQLGVAYHETGKYRKEKELYEKAEKDFPDNINLIYHQATLALTIGDTIESNHYFEKYRSLSKEQFSNDTLNLRTLGNLYWDAGILDKAEAYYEKSLSLLPGDPARMNDLAWFLIFNDRDINKGLELMDSLLKKSPDNYYYLHAKGWGLYKQGKYQEALELLQKSWDLRRQTAFYYHQAFLHLEAARKAVADQIKNPFNR
jgi:tetratricopeptide (TPR) repeat protein